MEDEIRFGPFSLSQRRRELSTADGIVPLGGRAFDILLALLERPGEIVPTLNLVRQVWPGVTVEDNNVQVQVSALRRALGASRDMIQTVPGRGYLFRGEIVRDTVLVDPVEPVAPSTNLPVPLGPLIGRDAELAELATIIATIPLLTLTGPSGIGKTRLATELGRRALSSHPDGVWLIDLAPLRDPAVLPTAVAGVLGVTLGDRPMPTEIIAAAVAERRMLLLFDNCEHLVSAVAPMIEMLLKRAPGVSIVATSQEILRVQGEQVYRLDPLTVPPPGAVSIGHYGAVAFFCHRVAASGHRFVLDDDNAAAVAAICRRLDGIPLALEMAAPRVPLLGVDGLRTRLDERLELLTSGTRTAASRYRTLRDTVAWSVGLLDPDDQVLFRRLGIFMGSFSLDAAVDVALGDARRDWEVIDGLGRLVDRSLVTVEHQELPRYRLLETLRLFALEQLNEAGEHDLVGERHAEHYSRALDQAYDAWETTPDAEWLKRTAPELDNVRAALSWVLADSSRTALAVRLAGAAALLWDQMSLLTEGRRIIERARALLEPETTSALVARLLREVGILWYAADRTRALAALEGARDLYRSSGDTLNQASVDTTIAGIHIFLGDTDRAADVLAGAQHVLASGGRAKSLFNVMNNLGVLATGRDDMPAAREYFSQALTLARTQKSPRREAAILVNLAEVECGLGALVEAVTHARDGVERLRALNQPGYLGWGLVNLASYLLLSDSPAEAVDPAREALLLVRDEGGYILRACLQQWSLLALWRGDAALAARLIGYVDAGFGAAGEIRQPTEQMIRDAAEVRLTAVVSAADRADLAGQGARWLEREAVAEALAASVGFSGRS